jgi:hypothetical protein
MRYNTLLTKLSNWAWLKILAVGRKSSSTYSSANSCCSERLSIRGCIELLAPALLVKSSCQGSVFYIYMPALIHICTVVVLKQ